MSEYSIEFEGGEAVVGVGNVPRPGRGTGPGLYWRDLVTGEPVPMAILVGGAEAADNKQLLERILQRAGQAPRGRLRLPAQSRPGVTAQGQANGERSDP